MTLIDRSWCCTLFLLKIWGCKKKNLFTCNCSWNTVVRYDVVQKSWNVLWVTSLESLSKCSQRLVSWWLCYTVRKSWAKWRRLIWQRMHLIKVAVLLSICHIVLCLLLICAFCCAVYLYSGLFSVPVSHLYLKMSSSTIVLGLSFLFFCFF